MQQSESLSKFAPAFLKAQSQIKTALKDAENPYFHSKYADLNSVIEAVKPALLDNGLVFLQFPDDAREGTLALTTLLVHTSGEWVKATATVPLSKSDPQGFGSTVTYARRYGLQSITGLLAEDTDAEAAMNHKAPLPAPSPVKSVFKLGGK